MKRLKHPALNRGQKISVKESEVKQDYDRERPIFCLRYMQGKYSLPNCSDAQKCGFSSTLFNLSRMTWIELKMANRHTLGTEKINQDAIRVKIPEHITEDVTLLAFRFHELAPMVGYRVNNVFHIVWLDHDFTLYDHGQH